jgi:histidine kinase/histidine kinase/DNA gyrase B/HSP90-like ATPase
MHPIPSRGRGLALYLGGWALAATLLAALLVDSVPLSRPGSAAILFRHSLAIALPLSIIYAFICLSAWYVARSMPLSTTGWIRIVTTGLAAAVLSSGAWLAFARAWMALLARRAGLDAAGAFASVSTPIFGFGLLLYLLSLAVSYLLGSFEQSRETERRGLQVQVLAREAELRSLRAQIDPHFLFNSLHSISALTTSNPPAARRMCLLLADFLRDSLALGSAYRITLGRELALAGRFLEIERVRFGNRLQVELASGGADACLVPPLLLQPIVENAVTHGVAHVLAGGTIRIAASRGTATLTIVVENPCDPDRPRRTGTGLGLANVRARLRALHGDNARLSAEEREGVWRVEVSLPVERAEGTETPEVFHTD